MHTFVKLCSTPTIEHTGKRVFSESVVESAELHWRESILTQPHLWNGSMMSLAESRGHTLYTEEVDYLYWHFQWITGTNLGIRPIAVTGLLTLGGAVVLACRGANVTQDAARWELAPSGGLTPNDASTDKTPSLVNQLLIEAQEELNLDLALFASPILLGLLRDSQTRINDFVFLCDLSISSSDFTSLFALRESQEYTDLKIVSWDEIRTASWISETSRNILRAVGPSC